MRSLYVFVLFVYATSFLFLHIFYVLCRAVSLDHVFLIRQFIAFHRLHLSFHRARSSSFRPLVGLYPVLLCLIAIVTTQLITGVSLPVTYVSGHKMSPVLTDGDFIFVESVNPVHVKVNDLILFHRHIEERVTDDNNHVDVNNHVPKNNRHDLSNINQIKSSVDTENRKASIGSAETLWGSSSSSSSSKNSVKKTVQDNGGNSNIIPIFVRKVVKIEEFIMTPSSSSKATSSGGTKVFRFFVCSEEKIPEAAKCSYVMETEVVGKTCFRIPKAAVVLRYIYYLYKQFNSYKLRDKSVLSLSAMFKNYAHKNNSTGQDKLNREL